MKEVTGGSKKIKTKIMQKNEISQGDNINDAQGVNHFIPLIIGWK